MNDSEANVDLRSVGIAQVARCEAAFPKPAAGRRPAAPCAGSGWRTCPNGVCGAAAGRRCAPLSHQLSDQHGVGLVVSEVIVVGGPRVVVERDDVALRVQRAAHLERERRALRVPRRLLVPHPLHANRPAELLRNDTPPRSPHRRRPCGRSPAALPSRRRAPARAACRGTRQRRSACRTTSCRWNRSSSARSTDRPVACAGPMAVWPWNGISYSASTIFAAPASAASGLPTTFGVWLDVGVAPRMYVNSSSDARERRGCRLLPVDLQLPAPPRSPALRARRRPRRSCPC